MLIREFLNSGISVPKRDDRAGLGYGQLKQRFHKNYTHNGSFPYTSPVADVDDVEVDDETMEAADGKIYDFVATDFGAARSTDRMYYAGATTNLTACFDRPDDVLREISLVARDMTLSNPKPVTKSQSSTVGGFSSSKAFDQRPYRRTGTKRGWSEAPPLGKIASSREEENDDLYTLEDIADDSTSLKDGVFTLENIFIQEREAHNE